ncbi:MBOAT family protein [bacterium]|nr:MBOAT family protein [bacterium]
MRFDSIEFLLFLPLVAGLYALLPRGWRWILLLIASYAFYAFWRVDYLGLIVLSTLIDYGVSRRLERVENPRWRTALMGISWTANLGLLAYFKYGNWVVENLNGALPPENALGLPNILLPVGISFYTFQTLSYTLDVYHRRIQPERHLGYFALYVTYFPQLVAGPIERFDRLGPQLRLSENLTWTGVGRGLQLVLFGLVLKSAVADSLAPVVDAFYEQPEAYGSLDAAVALLFYAFQIYADFAGYSLVAIGSAQIFGVELMNNFSAPYRAHSIAGFWQRWHVSLSTWFRDYVYIPLGGNRTSRWMWARNILVVFGLSGLWHGAAWTFLWWGLGHGLLFLIERRVQPWAYKVPVVLRWLGVQAGVVLLWVWFRSPDASTAQAVFSRLLEVPEALRLSVPPMAVGAWLGLAVWEAWAGTRRLDALMAQTSVGVQIAVYALLVYGLIVGSPPGGAEFIYFRF